MTILVVADTHLTDATLRRLPAAVTAAAEQADLILHAGDVVHAAVLEHLGRLAPVHAVCGNNDHTLVGQLPERLQLDLEGVAVAMVHDAGPRTGRAARLRRWFPDAEVVVFGHSHEPTLLREDHGPLLLNPGSPTRRRRQPHPTYASLELGDGEILSARHHELPRP
jgi:uncharacterized protein